MAKLTKFPTNYFSWSSDFINSASKINSSLALNLRKDTPLTLDHYLNGVDKEILLIALSGGLKEDHSVDLSRGESDSSETKDPISISGRSLAAVIVPPSPNGIDPTRLVETIMAYPQGNALIDRMKFMIFERMSRERGDMEGSGRHGCLGVEEGGRAQEKRREERD
jgi:hypothetical protein